MSTQSLRERLTNSATRVAAREELRRRILEIVNRKYQLTDYAIWLESAPNYLPWNFMLQEIKSLDKDKKLRLEIIKPGHLVIHSLEEPPPEKPAAKPTNKSTSGKSTKRSGKASKKEKL